MTAFIHSATNLGYDGKLVEVESDSSNGLPGLVVVGLGNKAIDEAKERVRAAIKNSGLDFPRKRVTINLAPADLPKDGSHLDLPIALSILSVSKQIPERALEDTLVVGELSLDGSLKPVSGVIAYAETARAQGFRAIIVPALNVGQAALIDGLHVLGARTLREAYLHATSEQSLAATRPAATAEPETQPAGASLDAIYGQEQAKRALVIAAAGGHNILFDGPPGSGKTMLARTLTSLLPPLSSAETIEVTKLHSMAGGAPDGVITTRPFRSPHHSASMVALIGGGARSKPGEISLAHRGVLFLDELPEYNRSALESLRQPLEDKVVHIARANHRSSYPANFMLVATQNPCPCGFASDSTRSCSCTAAQIARYRQRVSGPLLDRIDLFVPVAPIDHQLLLKDANSHQHETAHQQILGARSLQHQRYKDTAQLNTSLTNTKLTATACLDRPAEQLLNQAAAALQLSARSYFKTIKVARTIADLEASATIKPHHISEALQYRPRTDAL